MAIKSTTKCILLTVLIVVIALLGVFSIKYIRKLPNERKAKLIVIAINGLTFSQIQPDSMPFLTQFYRNGVYCPKMRPVFPTKTTTNLFSIATGLYAESHGVTSDVIYDNKLNEVIEFSPEMFMLKPNITPIWTLNELAGKRHSAVLWTAGEFMYRGTKPGHVIPIDAAIPWKQHIDENLIPLLLRRECIHNLAMFHVNYDLVSRTYSPQSKQFMDMLKDFDKMLQYLSEQLNKADLSDVTDIIIVSDHGIDTIHFHPENVDGDIIDLYRVIDPDSCDMYGTTVLQIIARPGHNQTELCAKLQQAAAFNGNYNVYTNDDLKTKKAHWHVYNEQRFGPCTAVANPGFAFQTIRDKLRKDRDYEKLVPGELIGRHGYDNFAPSMQAVFLANGPRFRCGIEIRSVHNIDLYHLFARLLNIQMHVPNLHIDGIDRPEIWTQMLNENVMKNE